MSNNAVFCISNNIKTIRVTVYRCKPNTFLLQLEQFLKGLAELDIDELVMVLLDNGFELDAESGGSFTAADMSTSTLVNWAWSLDLNSKELSYWDVTAALNGLQDTIEQDSISPLDFSNWLASEAVEDYESQINDSKNKLSDIGITIANF